MDIRLVGFFVDSLAKSAQLKEEAFQPHLYVETRQDNEMS
jgi:hypothetical protein